MSCTPDSAAALAEEHRRILARIRDRLVSSPYSADRVAVAAGVGRAVTYRIARGEGTPAPETLARVEAGLDKLDAQRTSAEQGRAA